MRLVPRLSLASKILALCGTLTLPIGYLVYNMVTAYNKDLDFASQELLGDRYLRPLMALLEDMARHRIAAERLVNGETDAKDLIAKIEAAADKHLSDLRAVDEEIGADLQFTDEGLHKRKRDHLKVATFSDEWEHLKRDQGTLTPAASNERNTHMIADLRGMITHAGDTSNLILDPDLDTYYLMDAVLLSLPQTADRLQQALSYGLGIVHRGEASLMEETKLGVFAAMMTDDDLVRTAGDIDTALNEDANFNGKHPAFQKAMPPAMAALTSKAEPFISLVRNLGENPKSTVAPEFLNQGLASLDQTFRMWEESADMMDQLLQTRVATFEAQKTSAFRTSSVTIFLFLLMNYLVTRRLASKLVFEMRELTKEASDAQVASVKLSSNSEALASTGAEQAAAIQETIAAVSEIGSMVAQTVTQAKASQDIAVKVSDKTNEGGRIMDAMVHSMESIDEANAQLQSISNIISEISAKTNVINDIVFKTQLLSFNASIEAARAGQHGRGFAVVAEEVGNLAQMSGNAAKEIRTLLEDSGKQVAGIVESTQQRVQEGKEVSHQAQTIFMQIAREVNDISSQIQSVSEASQEQKLGIEQISKAMGQMEGTTKANSAAAKESAGLSRSLKLQSQKLTTISRTLDTMIRGGTEKKAKARTSRDADSQTPAASLQLVKDDGSAHGTQEELVERLVARANAERAAPLTHGDADPSLTAEHDSFNRRAS